MHCFSRCKCAEVIPAEMHVDGKIFSTDKRF